MSDRASKKILLNPSWEEMVKHDPLIAYSFYLSGRVNCLLDVSREVTTLLDEGFGSGTVDGSKVGRAEMLGWLWVLGAFEIIRTMNQSKRRCFTEQLHPEMTMLKKRLAMVRVPATKLEEAGGKLPISSDRSPSGWHIGRKDLIVSSPHSGEMIYLRDLFLEFENFVASTTPQDVLARHEDAYTPP